MPARARKATTAGTDPLAGAVPPAPAYTLGAKRDSASTGFLHDLTLPSGATCQARRPGVQGLIAAGLLDNFDELTALVKTQHIDPKSPRAASPAGTAKVTPEETQSAAEEMMRDPDKLATAFHMMDRLAAYVVTQPKVWIDYQTKDETDEAFAARQAEAERTGAVAVRNIDMDDKVFLMNWAVGGSSDLAAFREGRSELLAGLAAS